MADEGIDLAFEHLDASRQAGHCIAVLGIGDGSLVRATAKFAPTLPLGRQQEIVLVEPDVARLIAGLGCNDLSGPDGPIAQERFTWYVGKTWSAQLLDDLVTEPTKMYPQGTCWGGEARPEILSAFDAVSAGLRDAQRVRQRTNEAYYSTRSDRELLTLLGPTPPRRPRVLMITSQFTAVLQHSTNDSADAMRQLGWEVRVLTEPHAWHCVAPPSIQATIADFRPDLVFQIDHLRYEHGEVVPPRLPFVCWIQDHLTNLTSPVAGPTIGPRDFVLTGGVYKYVERHGYPRSQCIDMAKVSREPIVPASWDEDAHDLLYVSHWSQSPESILIETTQRVGEIGGAPMQRLFQACATELTQLYERDGAARLDLEMRAIVRRHAARERVDVPTSAEQFLVDVLFQRLNNALYRQQALTWAGQIADERGLSFGLYGSGWENHPTLSKYARGPVQYGPSLESLTRRSKILLQLEPYPCFSHQRMLDALLAGGFALIRSHPMNTLAVKVRTFLDLHLPASVISSGEARRRMPEDARDAFESLLAESEMFGAMGDVVDVIRGWQRAGTLGDSAEALPHLDAIEFDDRTTLAARVDRFLNDRPARRAIADSQRVCVRERLTYASALRRATTRLYERLATSLALNADDCREAA